MQSQVIIIATVVTLTAAVMTGGFSDMDKDKGLEKAVQAHQKLREGSNDLYRRRIIKVKSAKQQVVAGMNYDLEFYDGATKCTLKVPMDKVTPEKCPFDKQGRVELCTVRLYEPLPAYEQPTEISRFNCEPVDGAKRDRLLA